MKDRIVVIHVHCDSCNCDISASINSPKIVHLNDNNQAYIHTHCPYCRKNFYIKLVNNDAVNTLGKYAKDDLLTDANEPVFKEYIKQEEKDEI